jgi:hypothetical protein
MYLEWSVYVCLSATLLSASAQKVRAILLTSYSCYLTITFRSVDIRDFRIYGTVLSLYVLLLNSAHIRA